MHKSSAREASANAATGKTTTAAAEIHAWGRGASAGGGCVGFSGGGGQFFGGGGNGRVAGCCEWIRGRRSW